MVYRAWVCGLLVDFGGFLDGVNLGQVIAEVGELEAPELTQQRDQRQTAPVERVAEQLPVDTPTKLLVT